MPASILVGGLYACRDSNGQYRVCKVLVLDEHAVHLRSYANRFTKLPAQAQSARLSMGSLDGDAGFGIGHFPLAREAFERDEWILVGREEVTYEELDGYRIWAGIDPIE